MCYFLRGLHDGCGLQDYLFLRKMQEFVRECLERNNFSKLKLVFKGNVLKFEMNVCMMRTCKEFIFWKGRAEIFLQLNFK